MTPVMSPREIFFPVIFTACPVSGQYLYHCASPNPILQEDAA